MQGGDRPQIAKHDALLGEVCIHSDLGQVPVCILNFFKTYLLFPCLQLGRGSGSKYDIIIPC